MNKTKKKILSTARTLFNEQGYGNVTIRMIAQKLGMSSGNLNYHFKKREDILEVLYFEMVEVFDKRVSQLPKNEITLKTIKNDVFLSLKRMIEYRFIWTDLYNLTRENSKIKAHFEAAYKKRYKGYEFLFDYLNKKQIMRDFEFEKESHYLIQRMISYSDTWLYNSFIYEVVINDEYVDLQSNNLLSMLYPYLTDIGKNEYNSLRIF